MKPKIGVSAKIFGRKWFTQLDTFPSKVVEANRMGGIFHMNDWWINKKLKPLLKGYDLSLHSSVCRLFSANDYFDDTQLRVLKAEIMMAKLVKAKQLIFHLKQEKLTSNEAKRLRKVLDFGKKQGIEMIFEGNAEMMGETCLNTLKRFPHISHNLDFGHINRGYRIGTLGMEVEEYIAKVRDRITYVHAHDNDGTKDQHLALGMGNFDWKNALDQLDLNRVKKIIVEVNKREHAIISKKKLEKYLGL